MAHFAQLDEHNVVIDVHVVHNNEMLTPEGVESEDMGKTFFINWSGGHQKWAQTSYNGTFRKNYAGKGYTYDAQRDAFIPPKPYPSWVLNESTCVWDAPVAYPTNGYPLNADGDMFQWNEETLAWFVYDPTIEKIRSLYAQP